MTQQQQDKTTAEWNAWFTASFDKHMEPHIAATNENTAAIDQQFDGLGDEFGTIADQHDKKIFELLEIVQVLATGNDFLCGRIDQITREFKHQNGIEHKEVRTIERTIATTTEEERTSRVSQTLAIVEEVLNG